MTPRYPFTRVPVTTTGTYSAEELDIAIRPDLRKPRTHLFVAAPKVLTLTADQARALADALHDQADELDS